MHSSLKKKLFFRCETKIIKWSKSCNRVYHFVCNTHVISHSVVATIHRQFWLIHNVEAVNGSAQPLYWLINQRFFRSELSGKEPRWRKSFSSETKRFRSKVFNAMKSALKNLICKKEVYISQLYLALFTNTLTHFDLGSNQGFVTKLCNQLPSRFIESNHKFLV